MDILILLVIAVFIVTGVFIGFHASQAPVVEGGGHSLPIELEAFGMDAIPQHAQFAGMSKAHI